MADQLTKVRRLLIVAFVLGVVAGQSWILTVAASIALCLLLTEIH
jgi:hypothetical protein